MSSTATGQNVVAGSAHKPSLRKRLFSSSSKKQRLNAPDKSILHTVENSASTSTTLTGEPANASSPDEVPVPGSQIMQQQPTITAEDNDKDRGSLNTTLTGHQRLAPVASEAGLSSSSTSHTPLKSSPTKQRRRRTGRNQSFISRFVNRVVPCVGSDPRRFSQSLPDPEKQPAPMRGEKAGAKSSDPSYNQFKASNNKTALTVATPPTLGLAQTPSIQPPPSPAESEIIVTPPPTTQLLPEDVTDGLTSGAVQPPGSTAEHSPGLPPHPPSPRDSVLGDAESEGTNYSDEEIDEAHQLALDEQAEEERLIRNGGAGIPIGPDGKPQPLLPPLAPEHAGRKCLVLDLDETLLHSSFKAVAQADFVVPVEIEYHWHHFHVLKRPGVDNFLKKMGEIYEIVIYTASLSKYADPVLDKLDIHRVVNHRLFRESCFNHKGNYVKDLSQLGRPMEDTIILDNSPASYIFHPNNAVPVSSWFNDPHDAELTDLIPFLADLSQVPDIRGVLDSAI